MEPNIPQRNQVLYSYEFLSGIRPDIQLFTRYTVSYIRTLLNHNNSFNNSVNTLNSTGKHGTGLHYCHAQFLVGKQIIVVIANRVGKCNMSGKLMNPTKFHPHLSSVFFVLYLKICSVQQYNLNALHAYNIHCNVHILHSPQHMYIAAYCHLK